MPEEKTTKDISLEADGRVRWLTAVTPVPPVRRRTPDPLSGFDVAAPAPEHFEVPMHSSVRRRDAVYRRLLALGDLIAAALALVVSVELLGADHLRPIGLVAAPLVIVVFKIAGLYDRDELRLKKTTLDEAPELLRGATLFTLLLAIFEQPFLVGELGDQQLLAVWVSLFAFTSAARVTARRIARRTTAPERCLVLGEISAARALRDKLEDAAQVRVELIGRVPLEPEEWEDPAALGTAAELGWVIATHSVDRVIVCPRKADSESLLEIVQAVKAYGVKVSVLPRLFEVVGSSVVFDHVEGMTLLGVRRFGLTQSSHLVKRGLDVTASALGLLLLAPLFVMAALAIRLDSPGPVFFRQVRVGRDGRHFRMFKFRSMREDADALKSELAGENISDGLFKIPEDPRVTRVGRLLRNTSLDELPQLINVLRGDMSLVGPRPLVVEEDNRVEGWHRRRLHLKPGMTGHWQVLGSSARIPLREMVTIDYLYVANWSLWGDIKTLLRTIPHVVGRRGM